MAPVDRTRVDFWMDPLCPWSWLTAEWLVEVQGQAPLEVTWGVMSLSVLNEGADLPPEWDEFRTQAWGPVRVLEAALQQAGQAAFMPLVRGIAQRWHVEERRDLPAILDEAVAECGLPASVAAAAWTDDLDEAVRLSHKRSVARTSARRSWASSDRTASRSATTGRSSPACPAATRRSGCSKPRARSRRRRASSS